MSKDLMYAAIKSIKIPDLQLKPGRYEINETITLQGTVIVGLPTFYQKSTVSIDTFLRICGVLNMSQAKAIKLFNSIVDMTPLEQGKAIEKYGISIALAEQETRQ
jgi:flavorubredoxin